MDALDAQLVALRAARLPRRADSKASILPLAAPCSLCAVLNTYAPCADPKERVELPQGVVDLTMLPRSAAAAPVPQERVIPSERVIPYQEDDPLIWRSWRPAGR